MFYTAWIADIKIEANLFCDLRSPGDWRWILLKCGAVTAGGTGRSRTRALPARTDRRATGGGGGLSVAREVHNILSAKDIRWQLGPAGPTVVSMVARRCNAV